MTQFEIVTRFKDSDLPLPTQKTNKSAGYDFIVAEDTVVPSYHSLMTQFKDAYDRMEKSNLTLDEMAKLTKQTKIKPTLVSTGMKCKLDEGTYLELSARSSTPLKYWLIVANGVGIIDADYYNNEDNEGEIFFQLINLSPAPICLKKGDSIGQGIVKRYMTAEGTNITNNTRKGGFGSTDD